LAARVGSVYPRLTNPKSLRLLSRKLLRQWSPLLLLLREGTELARHLDEKPWQFSIEYQQLVLRGATDEIIQRLMSAELIQHSIETSEDPTSARTFVRSLDLSASRSCFVITPAGVPEMINAGIISRDNGPVSLRPVWCNQSKELRIAGQLVKQFRWQASNQQLILDRFQQLGWPTRIDDPIPMDGRVCPRKRLHDAIKCLNRRHPRRLVRFHGDGTSKGVEWRLAKPV